jgi:hypothetical protein
MTHGTIHLPFGNGEYDFNVARHKQLGKPDTGKPVAEGTSSEVAGSTSSAPPSTEEVQP